MPLPTANLRLRYEAANLALAGGASITTWPDQASAYDATQDGANAVPTLDAAATPAGLPAALFASASAQRLLVPGASVSGLAAATVIALAKRASAPTTDTQTGPPFGDFGTVSTADHYPYTNGTIYHDFGSNARRSFTPAAGAIYDWHTFSILTESGNWQAWLNGASAYSTATNTVAWNVDPKLGGAYDAGNYAFDGHLAAILIYGAALSDADRQAAEQYLVDRYVNGVAGASALLCRRHAARRGMMGGGQ